MRPIIILGTGELAQLACLYFSHDGDREVLGFTVDRPYLTDSRCADFPVVALDVVASEFPPQDCDMFVAIGYQRLNAARAEKCAQAKAMGYRLASYVSGRSATWPDLQLGENSMVMEGCTVQPFVKIGDGVIVWSGSQISHHATIGDYSFIAAHAVIAGKVNIGRNCFIGVNATIRDKVIVADRTIVGAGALILEDTCENGSYLGAASAHSGIPSSRMSALL